jgi:glycosyltransferase involved in cell wall biosynthesis
MAAIPSTSPRVSVIMTVGRDLRFLDEAVDSIVRQDFCDFEFLIVDDDAGERAVFRSLAERDPRIRVLTNRTNLGAAASANRGIAASRGEIIVRLDADDIAEPRRIQQLVAALDADPELGLIGSWCGTMDENGVRGEIIRFPESDLEIRWTILFYNPFLHSSVAYRRRCFDATPGYRADQLISHDYYLWADMLEVTRARNIRATLAHYRRNSRGLTATNTTNWRARTHTIREKLWARLGIEYDLYDNERARDVARFVAGSPNAGGAQAQLTVYRTILPMLDRFLALEAPRARPVERDIAERLCRDVVNRVLAHLPSDGAPDLIESVGRLDRWSTASVSWPIAFH